MNVFVLDKYIQIETKRKKTKFINLKDYVNHFEKI